MSHVYYVLPCYAVSHIVYKILFNIIYRFEIYLFIEQNNHPPFEVSFGVDLKLIKINTQKKEAEIFYYTRL